MITQQLFWEGSNVFLPRFRFFSHKDTTAVPSVDCTFICEGKRVRPSVLVKCPAPETKSVTSAIKSNPEDSTMQLYRYCIPFCLIEKCNLCSRFDLA
ncbi:hypothetical protein AKJ16_DCAP23749 [Drosera capensis]